MPDVPRTPAAIATDPTDGTVCIWFDARQPGSMGPDPGLAGGITPPDVPVGGGRPHPGQTEGGQRHGLCRPANRKPDQAPTAPPRQPPPGPLLPTPPPPARPARTA